jgi:hypothetical protein
VLPHCISGNSGHMSLVAGLQTLFEARQ